MTRFGYTLVMEQNGPKDPVRYAISAEHQGLDFEAGVVADRKLTSYPSIRTDLRNAGAKFVGEEVVVDGNLVTSRSPSDLPAFCT
jgi:putative intracellular protease/amidase